MMIYLILLYLSLSLVFGNDLMVNIQYGENNTFLLSYDLTTKYSYYLTFRLFEQEQRKFGLFSPTNQRNTLQIYNQYNSSTTLFYLFIICFHFLRQPNDIDIQCRDIRLLKLNPKKSPLPTYKPLFVPLMYALSILMLLPVIIQHRRRKQAQLTERRKQIKRLSITIAQENPDILSSIVQSESLNLKKIPIQIELVSFPSTKTILDDIDDNDVTFTLQKLLPFIEKEDDQEETPVTADDCIAHLLNNAPWSSAPTQQSIIKTDPRDTFKEPRASRITTLHGNNDEDEQQPILKSTPYSTINLFKSNPAFMESDV